MVGSTCDTTVNSDFSLEFTSAGQLDYAVWEGGLRTNAMCAWIKTTDQQNYGTVFSYATDEEANSLTLTDYSGFVLYVNGAKVVTDVTANEGRWQLICATWNSPDGQWRIYSDGELKDKGSDWPAIRRSIPTGPSSSARSRTSAPEGSAMPNPSSASCTASSCGIRSWTTNKSPA